MALIKFCDHCKTTYPYEEHCPNGCTEKLKRKRNKEYNEYSRRNQDIYDSKAWKKVRSEVIGLDGICLWSYYMDNRIVNGKVIHHIIEVEEDRRRAFDKDNLIFVSDQAHRTIHALYQKDKPKTQQILTALIKRHRKCQ